MASAILMGIDPGPSPGVACRITLSDGRYEYLAATLSSTEEMLSWIKANNPSHLACESFNTGGRVDHNMLYTIECVGAVKATCFLLNIPICMQRPSERTSFIADAKNTLKQRHPTNHEVDALAHLFLLEHRNGERE